MDNLSITFSASKRAEIPKTGKALVCRVVASRENRQIENEPVFACQHRVERLRFCRSIAASLPVKPLMSRREKIQAMLADDPTDTFLRYSLAMEYRSEGEHEQSLSALGELTRDSTPYVPAFFMAAQQLVEMGQISQARGMLRQGIDEARRQSDAHAAAEMSELLASLGSLGSSDGEGSSDDDDDL